jgi:hypothetical protein
LLILCSFTAAYFCFWLLPNAFEIGNSQAVDQSYVLRASSQKFRPVYNPSVAHIDLNNASLQRLAGRNRGRRFFNPASGGARQYKNRAGIRKYKITR